MITKEDLIEILNKVLKSKHTGDNYSDGVLDMYNAIVKQL